MRSSIPGRLQNFVEGLVEFMLCEIQKVTGDQKRARQFFPIVGSIFLFVIFQTGSG